MFAFMVLLKQEEQEQFTAMYRQYYEPMCRYARQLLGSRAQAEDAVQEAFTRIIKHLHQLVEVDCSKTRNYLFITVKRIALDTIHKEANKVVPVEDGLLEERLISELDPVWDAVESSRQRKVLEQLLGKLPEEDYVLLRLRMVNECSYREIAGLLGLSETAVSVRLSRIRARLRRDYVRDEMRMGAE